MKGVRFTLVAGLIVAALTPCSIASTGQIPIAVLIWVRAGMFRREIDGRCAWLARNILAPNMILGAISFGTD